MDRFQLSAECFSSKKIFFIIHSLLDEIFCYSAYRYYKSIKIIYISFHKTHLAYQMRKWILSFNSFDIYILLNFNLKKHRTQYASTPL